MSVRLAGPAVLTDSANALDLQRTRIRKINETPEVLGQEKSGLRSKQEVATMGAMKAFSGFL